MPWEILVGLGIEDPARYAEYRAEMTPLLQAAGGDFRFDFEVGANLKNGSGQEINRIFAIAFPDREAKKRFFTDPVYLEIRSRLFAPAVKHVVALAEYERLADIPNGR